MTKRPFLTWWTSVETDLRKSYLVGAHKDTERLHALIRMAYEAGQADATPKLAHGHREDFYLLANARRIGLMPIRQVANMSNWHLAHELFATGSNSSHQICVDAGIDPYGHAVEHRAAAQEAGA